MLKMLKIMMEVPATPIPSVRAQDDAQDPDSDDETARASDDEPMVHRILRDYGAISHQQRDQLISEGVHPDSLILVSELNQRVSRNENETSAEYSKRRSETVEAMVNDGAMVLNDTCTADIVASHFSSADGREFDLGPNSGVTKGESREFKRWFAKMVQTRQEEETPEKWLKFQVKGKSA